MLEVVPDGDKDRDKDFKASKAIITQIPKWQGNLEGRMDKGRMEMEG